MAGRKVKSYVKSVVTAVRLTEDEVRLLEKAARLETQRRGELVHEGSLLRELGMLRVREIVQAAAA